MRRLAVLLVILLALLGVGAFAFVRAVSHAIVDAPNHGVIPDPEPGERMVMVGPPAAALAIKIVEPATPARALIFVLHGIHNHKESMGDTAACLAAAGYRAVLVDSRGHGRSSGDWLTYGVQESRDLTRVLDALSSPSLGSGGLPVGVVGVSYGAATALEWAAREPRVGAVVALAPFSSLRAVVPAYAARLVPLIGRWMPSALVQAGVDAAGRLAGFDPDQASPLAARAARPVPALIFHGADDEYVAPAQSRALAAAAPATTTLVLLDGQGHNGLAGDARVWPAITDFFARTLGAAAAK